MCAQARVRALARVRLRVCECLHLRLRLRARDTRARVCARVRARARARALFCLSCRWSGATEGGGVLQCGVVWFHRSQHFDVMWLVCISYLSLSLRTALSAVGPVLQRVPACCSVLQRCAVWSRGDYVSTSYQIFLEIMYFNL